MFQELEPAGAIGPPAEVAIPAPGPPAVGVEVYQPWPGRLGPVQAENAPGVSPGVPGPGDAPVAGPGPEGRMEGRARFPGVNPGLGPAYPPQGHVGRDGLEEVEGQE